MLTPNHSQVGIILDGPSRAVYTLGSVLQGLM